MDLIHRIPMDNALNKQYKERIEAKIKFGHKNISEKEAIEYFRRILEYTMPFEASIRNVEKYLTNAEMQCLLNIAVYSEVLGDSVVFNMLIELCEQMETDEGVPEHIAVWETIMTNIANIYGDRGDYDKSDAINIRIVNECVYCYRMNILDINLYISAWNNSQRKKKNIPTVEGYQEIEYLKNCVAICQINRNTERENRIKERLMMLLKNETKNEIQ